jgi:hypothetical protein
MNFRGAFGEGKSIITGYSGDEIFVVVFSLKPEFLYNRLLVPYGKSCICRLIV